MDRCISAMPSFREHAPNVVLDNNCETKIKHQIADLSRALIVVIEICDAGHPRYVNRVVFARRGGIIVNVEKGTKTSFKRENSIYCWGCWVKPLARQGNSTNKKKKSRV